MHALFTGMQDTLVVRWSGVTPPPGSIRWTSTDAAVLIAESTGIVAAAAPGVAYARVEYNDTRDSVQIAVVDAPAGQIVFAGQRADTSTPAIWVMSVNGSGLTAAWVGLSGSSLANPSASPDGCSIAFQYTSPTRSSPQLMRLDLSTGIAQSLTRGGSGPPAWSPTESLIVFAGLTLSGFNMFSIHTDGTRLTTVTALGAPLAFPLAFFPDGRSLVFEKSEAEGGTIYGQLFRLALDSPSVQTPLVEVPRTDNRSPAVSPDGRELAFQHSAQGGPATIQIRRADGRIEDVTPPAVEPAGAQANATGASFSLDGEWLAFSWSRDMRETGTNVQNGNAEFNTVEEIYAIRSDGSYPVRLTHFWFAHGADWSHACSKR